MTRKNGYSNAISVPSVVEPITACQTSSARAGKREVNLAGSGVLARPANTPERQATRARLPAHKFGRHAKGMLTGSNDISCLQSSSTLAQIAKRPENWQPHRIGCVRVNSDVTNQVGIIVAVKGYNLTIWLARLARHFER